MAAVTRLGLYGGPRFNQAAGVSIASAAITGTATSGLTESQVVTGGETIIITLTNDTWVTAGATFNAQRQNIIDGVTAAEAEATGWNAEVRDKEVVTSVVRTSDTVVTITLSAAADYNVTANETITVTVPATALDTSSSEISAFPAISVIADAVASGTGGHFGGSSKRKIKRSDDFKQLVDDAVDEAIAVEAPETAPVTEDAPKLTKSKEKKVREYALRETLAANAANPAFTGKLESLQTQLDQLITANLAQRRVERRRKLALMKKKVELDQVKQHNARSAQLLQEEEDIIMIIKLLADD